MAFWPSRHLFGHLPIYLFFPPLISGFIGFASFHFSKFNPKSQTSLFWPRLSILNKNFSYRKNSFHSWESDNIKNSKKKLIFILCSILSFFKVFSSSNFVNSNQFIANMPSNKFLFTALAILLVPSIISSFGGEIESDECTNDNTKCFCGKRKEENEGKLIEFYKKPTAVELYKMINGEEKEFELVEKENPTESEKLPSDFLLLLKANTWEMLRSDGNVIYRASPISEEFGSKECVAIKIIKFDHLVERKPRDYVEHELEMLELAKKEKIDAVVELLEGHSLRNAVFMILELGEMDLGKYLEQKREEINTNDLLKLFSVMASRLAQFHKIAIHNALKPANWVVIKNENTNAPSELNLKLIDLQTSIPVKSEDGVVKNPLEYRKFICRSGARQHEARSLRSASPEMRKFCRTANRNENNGLWKFLNNIVTPKLCTKSDVWSLGVAFCEIFIFINPTFLDGIIKKSSGKKHEKKPFEYIVNAFSYLNLQGNVGYNSISWKILEKIKSQSSILFDVLKGIFKKNANGRFSASKISSYIKERMKN